MYFSDQVLEKQRYETFLKFFNNFRVIENEQEAILIWKSLYTIKPKPKVNGSELGKFSGIDDIVEYLNLARPSPDRDVYLDPTLDAPFTKDSCYTGNKLTWHCVFFFL